jgi:DNA-binding CsgD family transcriptional regulator
MNPRDCPASARLVGETLEFLRATLGCGAAMFSWVEPDLSTSAYHALGLPEGLTQAYRHHGWRHDPLHTARLAARHCSLAELDREAHEDPQASAPYRAFLGAYGMGGDVEFLFWAAGAPWGVISLLPLAGEALPASQWPRIEAVHRYVALTMQAHAVARHAQRRAHLLNHIGLTPRECELCDLVAVGAGNADIAQMLGLTTATVKTYLRRIFDKMGVDSRTALAARLSGLGAA